VMELFEICRALGLSGAAGLNAYIPLLVLGVMQNRGIVHLNPPYDVLGTWWCIGILVVLLAVEMVVDKVPGADHINDIMQTVIRPAAGAILFLASVGGISGVHPAVWVILGLLLSGGVHGVKALTRPVMNVASVGLAAPIVSLVEDLVSVVLSIVAILVPVMAVILLVVFGWILWKLFARFVSTRKTGEESKQRPIAVPAVPMGTGDLAGKT
jgi:Domain of unknown function (DUF4126)